MNDESLMPFGEHKGDKMNKYKLVQIYPGSPKLGFIIEFNKGFPHVYPAKANAGCNCYVNLDMCKLNPEFWAEYKFTTEDGIDMFDKENFWLIDNFLTLKYWEVNKSGFLEANFDYLNNKLKFSTKAAAQEYINSITLKAAKKNIHIKNYPSMPKQKGSDLDINKTCGTCKFETTYASDGYPCKECGIRLKYHINWQPKEPKFEEGVWYKDKGCVCALYKAKRGNSGFVGTQWAQNIAMYGIKGWKKANMKEVERLLLEEARRRYPKNIVFKSIRSGLKVISYDGKAIVIENRVNMWESVNNTMTCYENGKWAEIMEEPKLMLGDTEVKITEHEVQTNEGSVLHGEWLVWFEIVDKFYEHTIAGEIVLRLGDYKTLSVTGMYTEIGCIKKITYDQLKVVTKAIKEL